MAKPFELPGRRLLMSASRTRQVIHIADPVAEVVAETASGCLRIIVYAAVFSFVQQGSSSVQYAAQVPFVTAPNLIDHAFGICSRGSLIGRNLQERSTLADFHFDVFEKEERIAATFSFS